MVYDALFGMGISLSEPALKLVDGKNYAVLATVNADGSPQAWPRVDDARRGPGGKAAGWRCHGRHRGEVRTNRHVSHRAL